MLCYEATYSLHELQQVVHALLPLLAKSPVVALYGQLGAGKTTLVQALCVELGVTAQVTSPTFTLVHSYASPKGPLHHFDFYRLNSSAETHALGLHEYFDSGEICLIEWPEVVADLLPPHTLQLHLKPLQASQRHLSVYC